MARGLRVAPTIFAGIRLRRTTFIYDDADHPARASGTIESPDFTIEDQALLLGLDLYESSLCPGPCGMPRHVAWHTEMDGWFEDRAFKCHACTAMATPNKDGERHPVIYHISVDTREDAVELPPFVLGVTTSAE